MSDIGEELQQLVLQAIDVGIDAFTNGESDPFVFFVDGAGESHTVVIAADEGTEGSDLVAIARQTVSQGLGQLAQLYALTYDGSLTTDGEKFDAVFVEAGERGEAVASLIAQRYRVKKRSRRAKKVGAPTIVDSAGHLLTDA